MPILFASSCSDAGEVKSVHAGIQAVHASQGAGFKQQVAHLRAADRLGDLLNHPAFQSFSHLMLPWDGRDYDRAMPLTDIGRLLPYHSHVEPAVVVAALNRMVDDVSIGRTVFYNFYTDDQRRTNSALKHAGLFFFRGKPDAPFAIIAPGGGFSYVGSVHEGFPYAEEISRRGFNAFVVKYRAGQGGRAATEDLAAAVSYILQSAHSLQVGTDGYSLWGSSAGARMAAAIGSHGTRRLWRCAATETCCRGDGIHRPFGRHRFRAVHLRRCGRSRRHRAARCDGVANCGAPTHWNAG